MRTLVSGGGRCIDDMAAFVCWGRKNMCGKTRGFVLQDDPTLLVQLILDELSRGVKCEEAR